MILHTLEFIDSQLLLLVNSCHTEWADHFMMMFSGRFIWIPMYLTLAFIIFRNFPLRKALIALVGVGIAIAMADQLCASVIRPVVGRLRPTNLDNPLSAFITIVDGYRGGSYGFPSCHAANSFALIAFVALLVPQRRLCVFLLVWAVVNSYSRLYLGVHYPGDLLVGGIIGMLVGAGVGMATRRVIGLPRPRFVTHELIPAENKHLRVASTSGALSLVGGLSLRVTDAAAAVGLTTVLIMAAIAA